MKLLLTILVICAVLVIANAELEEFSENAPAPYGPEAVEERACGNYKDKWHLQEGLFPDCSMNVIAKYTLIQNLMKTFRY
uniref:U34-Deinotoxin-Dsu1bk_1 n=1 Tax=Deinopis subrufa TaxID=1905329 RepID=A0A4V6MKB3_DEISU